MKWIKRILWLTIVCFLLITNVITAASMTLGNVLSGLLGTVLGRKSVPMVGAIQSPGQLRDENRRLKDRLESQRTAIADVGKGAAQRSKRLAMHNVAEMTLGALPVGGLTILIAGTAWELSQLCEGMKEMDSLYLQLEIEDEEHKGVMDYICDPSIPGLNNAPPNEQ